MESEKNEPGGAEDDLILTKEELAELLEPGEPLTGRQMVEAGVFGAAKSQTQG